MSKDKTPAADQRAELNQSEKKASEQQPGSYKEEESADKIVEIPPIDAGRAPIKGLDPKK